MGILALVCNLIALIPSLASMVAGLEISTGWFAFVGFVLAIIAVATGNGILKSDRTDKSARAGKAIGTVCLVLAILGIILFFLLPFIVGCIAVGILSA